MDAAERDMFRTSFDNPNVMSAAWALLKGNPAMRDAEGRAINHPAAMVYENLAYKVGEGEEGNETYPHEDDESVADRMEQMRKPTHQRRAMRRKKQGIALANDGKRAMLNDEAEARRLNQYRQEARDETDHDMRFGQHSNQEHEIPYKNYGVQQSTGTDVRMKPGNIMDHM
jgi:hypothetical protein